MADKYTYPDSEVLINNFDIRDALLLHAYERKYVTPLTVELAENPIRGNFDMKHLQQIHHHLFQDIYPWAGQTRDVDIARVDEVTGKLSEFCLCQHINNYQQTLFENLKEVNYLTNVDQDQFAEQAAIFFSELNALHPFREGNGRTQREFMRQLALNAGWELNFENITQERMTEASIDSFSKDYSGLIDITKESLRPINIVNTPEYLQIIKDIKSAPSISAIKRTTESRTLFITYARAALSNTNNKWDSKFDRAILTHMIKNKVPASKIEEALKYSPSYLGKSNIEKTITIKMLLRQTKQENQINR